jgi:hypothetical protein
VNEITSRQFFSHGVKDETLRLRQVDQAIRGRARAVAAIALT